LYGELAVAIGACHQGGGPTEKIETMSYLTHLECTCCARTFDADSLNGACPDDGRPLYARYDLGAIARSLRPGDLLSREASLWRYREWLPVRDPAHVVTLGEGWTPLLPLTRLAQRWGLTRTWVKDESQLPTGSFKARGMAVAVSRARELGIRRVGVPSAGNAGGALATYAARAGLEAFVFMPVDVPRVNQIECQAAGARCYLVRGLISDCGKLVRANTERMGWFDLSTLREPYRVEGKKTMGLELAEQLDWELPDVVIYPTGGGTGLVGMWKAWAELEEMGWIGSRRPRMVAVQAAGCAPLVRAFEAGAEEATPWTNAATGAAGLRVPSAIGDRLILQTVCESGGVAISVDEAEIAEAQRLLARSEGLFAAPEGAAAVAGLSRLIQENRVGLDERIVVFNTGSGLKYPEWFADELPVLEADAVLQEAL
jgi:threonine synthase